MARSPLSLQIVLSTSFAVLSACVPMRYNYYRPNGEGEVRNATLCVAGVRDQLAIRLADGVEARVSADAQNGEALSTHLALLIHDGHRVDFSTTEFIVTTDGGRKSYRATPANVLTTCYAGLSPVSCRPDLDPTEVFEGQTLPGSGVFPSKEPRVFTATVAFPVRAVEAFTLAIPILRVDGEPIPIAPVSFRRESISTVQGLCQ